MAQWDKHSHEADSLLPVSTKNWSGSWSFSHFPPSPCANPYSHVRGAWADLIISGMLLPSDGFLHFLDHMASAKLHSRWDFFALCVSACVTWHKIIWPAVGKKEKFNEETPNASLLPFSSTLKLFFRIHYKFPDLVGKEALQQSCPWISCQGYKHSWTLEKFGCRLNFEDKASPYCFLIPLALLPKEYHYSYCDPG